MNAFIVILCSAVAVSAIPQGWGPPPLLPLPIVDLELSGTVALAGDGSGSAQQTLSESASGGQAHITSISGVAVDIDHSGDIVQIASSSEPSGSSPATFSIQGVSASNNAIATDLLVADISGDTSASAENAAATFAEGDAALATYSSSLNSVITKKH